MKSFAAAIALVLVALATTNVPASAKEEGLMTTLPSNGVTVSEYYKQDVYDAHDNKIGDVSDVLLDKNGQVTAVILGVGGFLGVGEKDVAVPFNSVRLTEKDGKRYLVMDTTKEALQSATGYTYDRNKARWVPAAKQG
jgi:sporulation protein YlmC with PRC-barrel domain